MSWKAVDRVRGLAMNLMLLEMMRIDLTRRTLDFVCDTALRADIPAGRLRQRSPMDVARLVLEARSDHLSLVRFAEPLS